MEITAELIKSFTTDKEAGNPAGVVLDANSLTDEQILAITRELGFGESAFLQRATSDADYRLRLFSVEGEVNSCATATIAAAYVLFVNDPARTSVMFQMKQNDLRVEKNEDGSMLINFSPAELLESMIPIERDEIASLLSIPENMIADYPLEILSIGTPKLLIPITTLEDLLAIKPDLEGVAEYCKKSGARGFYPFTLETKKPNSDFHARQFNPMAGIAEDPVTGVAAGVLASYLKARKILDKNRFIGEQGYIINTPGEIVVELTDEATRVGGYAVHYGQREVEVRQ